MIPNNANVYLPGTIAIPSALTIIAISNSFPMVVTIDVNAVTESNTYIAGQLVRLNIPRSYGMFQASGLVGEIMSVDDDELSLKIDSTLFDLFIIPASTAEQPATLAPAGSRNLEFNNSTNHVPFQSLNNRGN